MQSLSDKTNSKFPAEADVVIVGVGGIVGSMLAYWLTELGLKRKITLKKSVLILKVIKNSVYMENLNHSLILLELLLTKTSN